MMGVAAAPRGQISPDSSVRIAVGILGLLLVFE